MSRDAAQKQTNMIFAAITLADHKVHGGNVFVVEAKDEEEQKELMLDIARAVRGEVMRTINGIYLVLKE